MSMEGGKSVELFSLFGREGAGVRVGGLLGGEDEKGKVGGEFFICPGNDKSFCIFFKKRP